jgi:hypothetical protein
MVTSTPACLEVTGNGSTQTPFDVKHKVINNQITVGGLTLDGFGHVKSFEAAESAGGIAQLVSTGKTITVTANESVAAIDLPGFHTAAQEFDARDVHMGVDMFGRVTKLEPAAPYTPLEMTFLPVDAGLTNHSVTLSLKVPCRFRASYKGDLGITVSGKTGLAALPAAISITLDGLPLTTAYAVCNSNGRIVGLEIFTSNNLAAGDHYLVIDTDTVAAPGPGLIDLYVCQ